MNFSYKIFFWFLYLIRSEFKGKYLKLFSYAILNKGLTIYKLLFFNFNFFAIFNPVIIVLVKGLEYILIILISFF